MVIFGGRRLSNLCDDLLPEPVGVNLQGHGPAVLVVQLVGALEVVSDPGGLPLDVAAAQLALMQPVLALRLTVRRSIYDVARQRNKIIQKERERRKRQRRK